MISPVIISGEASETDSDDNCTDNNLKADMSKLSSSSVVFGEDSESESDCNEIDKSGECTKKIHSEERKSVKLANLVDESLLHKKLKERNIKLYKNLDAFCKDAIGRAEKDISAIDHSLLRSQITLQSAITSLQSLNLNSCLLMDKLQFITTSKFIANIQKK